MSTHVRIYSEVFLISRPIVWHVSISGSRVESESNEPLPTAARRPEFIVNLVLGVRTCRLAAQASESDFEPLRTARAYDLDKRPSIVIRKFLVDAKCSTKGKHNKFDHADRTPRETLEERQ
jgi:hypothetical protein